MPQKGTDGESAPEHVEPPVWFQSEYEDACCRSSVAFLNQRLGFDLLCRLTRTLRLEYCGEYLINLTAGKLPLTPDDS